MVAIISYFNEIVMLINFRIQSLQKKNYQIGITFLIVF